MEQRRGEQVRIVVSGRQQLVDDVEGMAPVGNRHGLVERESPARQNPARDCLLTGIDPGANVRDRLHDPMHR
jgi:hypothetical protein